MSLASDFKAFILRGSVVDLAVGVVIGAAFTGVVTAFTKDLLTPLIGIPGKLNAGDIVFTVNGSRTTKLYDRRGEKATLEVIERIRY